MIHMRNEITDYLARLRREKADLELELQELEEGGSDLETLLNLVHEVEAIERKIIHLCPTKTGGLK